MRNGVDAVKINERQNSTTDCFQARCLTPIEMLQRRVQDDPPVVRRLREALQQALPGLRDLVNQQCPDPDIAARDRRVLALALEALNV